MNSCNLCSNPCNKDCKPARYSKGFQSNKCECKETDTKISIDNSKATLNYAAERHTDIFTGSQIGGIINLPDLRDVNIDYDFDAMCAEFIYHKYGECGNGCKSLEDAWNLFSIDQDGAKQDGIQYVRGANVYGCPVFLDVPTNENQYWFAGWRPNNQFGYYQPEPVTKLPTDSKSDPIVIGQVPGTNKPVVGTIPLSCLIDNMMTNFGMKTTIGFQAIQATPKFEATMNNSTGAFDIEWNDWYYNFTQHVGTGHILGRIMWDFDFNRSNGNMNYTITGVYFDKVTYETDKGAPSTAEHLFLTLQGVEIGSDNRTNLLTRYEFTGNSDWEERLDKTVSGSGTFTLTPGQSEGPFNFLYLYNDWESTYDDEGYLNISFQNTLNGWMGDCA